MYFTFFQNYILFGFVFLLLKKNASNSSSSNEYILLQSNQFKYDSIYWDSGTSLMNCEKPIHFLRLHECL